MCILVESKSIYSCVKKTDEIEFKDYVEHFLCVFCVCVCMCVYMNVWAQVCYYVIRILFFR